MSPFAENTRTLFGEAIKIQRPFQWKYLKDELIIPEYQSMLVKARPVIDAFHGIIYYSNQVVSINNSRLSERDKSQMLANYLDEVMEKLLAEKERTDTLQVDIDRARKILKNIRDAQTYLDALAVAEPIINGVSAAVIGRIGDIQNLIPAILVGFNREIEKKYVAARVNYEQLLRLQEKTMLSLIRLYNA